MRDSLASVIALATCAAACVAIASFDLSTVCQDTPIGAWVVVAAGLGLAPAAVGAVLQRSAPATE